MDPRRSLPSVDRVLRCLSGLPHALALDVAREAVEKARHQLGQGVEVSGEAVIEDARRRVGQVSRGLLQPVINATGVLLHTNLGRAPISAAALEAACKVGEGYSNLEFRLEEGARGSRRDHAGPALARACGAESALVVNNNAGAVLLVLAGLARGRQVVVSRGELVEIGGGFRIPDVMAESGARLVEVGTTNRTRARDYAAAVTPETALLLKVHPSNYRMIGFVEQARVDQLASLGAPVVVDAGSGLLDESTPWLSRRPTWLGDELGVRQCLEHGAALVTFSGDKLLGGPQAGVIAGRADLVEQLARHPLARALRPDKMTLAALEATVFAYLDGDAAQIPFWRLATVPLEELVARAGAIAAEVPGTEVVRTEAAAGGGSLPGLTIPSAGVAVGGLAATAPEMVAAAVLRELRGRRVVGRTEGGLAVLDLRSVEERSDRVLVEALASLPGRRD
ncbi:MAG: L-seryl-tRNA(Sec) selenium transferase [Acidimicrobiia bacterium]